MYGKYNSPPKTIDKSAVTFTFYSETCFYKKFFFIAISYSFLREAVSLFETVPELEFLYNIFTKSSFFKIT